MKPANPTPHHLRKATCCKNLILPFGDYTPVESYAMIRSNAFKKDTDLIRKYLAEGRADEATAIKKKQYGYTPSSRWFPTRRESNLKEITGNIIVECDHLDKPQLEHVAYVTYIDAFTMMGFVTSSGSGFKWICPTNATTKEEHRVAYKQLCEYYASLFGEGISGKLDVNQPDPVRLMFLSCDQSNLAFFKTNYKEFIFSPTQVIASEAKQSPDHGIASSGTPRNDSSEGGEATPYEAAAKMIADAMDGNKHITLLRAARLLGGYIAGQGMNEDDAIAFLESEISKRKIDCFKTAQKTIRDGIRYGKAVPIYKNDNPII